MRHLDSPVHFNYIAHRLHPIFPSHTDGGSIILTDDRIYGARMEPVEGVFFHRLCRLRRIAMVPECPMKQIAHLQHHLASKHLPRQPALTNNEMLFLQDDSPVAKISIHFIFCPATGDSLIHFRIGKSMLPCIHHLWILQHTSNCGPIRPGDPTESQPFRFQYITQFSFYFLFYYKTPAIPMS